MSVIVIEFITVDGIASDPDGSGGTPYGGWAFRHGPEQVAGDKFRLGRTLDDGVLLLGRRTWELFARIWPGGDDPFARRMNAVPKLVVSRTLTDSSAWPNSTVTGEAPADLVKNADRDVVVAGSIGVVHDLGAAGLVDEYRLLTFPAIAGAGTPLFRPGARAELECVSSERTGAAVLTTYRRR